MSTASCSRGGGRGLTGYLAFCVSKDQLQVKDWLGEDTRAVRTLFGAAIDQAFAARSCVGIGYDARDASRPRRDSQSGFRAAAESSVTITYAAESLPWRADVASADAWYMTVGDRDV